MEFKDYYATMGVEPNADLKTIKTAHRRLARKYHPDVSTEEDAESKFKELAEAYEVLKDEERRAEYDQIRLHRNDPNFCRQARGDHGGYQQSASWHGGGADAQDFSDFFESMFGGCCGRAPLRFALARRAWLPRPIRDGGAAVPRGNAAWPKPRDLLQAAGVRRAGAAGERSQQNAERENPGRWATASAFASRGRALPAGGGQNGDLYLVIRLAPHPLFEIDGHNLSIVAARAVGSGAGSQHRGADADRQNRVDRAPAARAANGCGSRARGWRARKSPAICMSFSRW